MLKEISRKDLGQYLLILVGSFIVAVAFILFVSPYKFVPGGVYGISIMIHHLTKGVFELFPQGLPIGVLSLCMDIPITLLGMKIIGAGFGLKTVIGFTSMSLSTTLLEFTWGYNPLVENEPLLSAVFGGLLIGIGSGLVFKAKASSGGTDAIAAMLSKFTRQPLGKLQIGVDAVVVLMSIAAFHSWAIPLFSLVIIYIAGKTIDVVLQGMSVQKALLIISEKHEEIRSRILKDMDRGGTYLLGKGMYEHADKDIILTVLERKEVEELKDFIRETDPKAFMAVLDASEVLGEGFKNLKEKNTF